MQELITIDKKAVRSDYFKQGFAIALPVMLQNLISVGLNIVDSIMIGGLGEAALAAVGSANQIYMIYSEVCFGMFSGAGVFVAQYWGIKDIKTVRKVVGIDAIVAITSAIAAIILIQFTAPVLIGCFADNAEVISYGAEYIQIAKYSYILMGISFCISFNCRAVQKLVAPTIISALAIAINTFLNWAMIYGHFGFEAMGVRGAAMATVITRAIEMTALIICVYAQKNHPLKSKIDELMSFGKELAKDVFKMSVPTITTEVMWAVCMACVYVAYGKISYESLAVVQVAEVVTCFFQCIFFGLGNATSIILGGYLGRNQKEEGYYIARVAVRVTWILNVIMSGLLILVRGPIVNCYNFSPETTKLLYFSLMIWAFSIAPKMLAYVLICGVFRAGGDTVFAMKVDVSLNLLQVGLAFFGVLVLKWDLPWVVALICSSEVIKTIIGYFRMISRKWINVITDNIYE